MWKNTRNISKTKFIDHKIKDKWEIVEFMVNQSCLTIYYSEQVQLCRLLDK